MRASQKSNIQSPAAGAAKKGGGGAGGCRIASSSSPLRPLPSGEEEEKFANAEDEEKEEGEDNANTTVSNTANTNTFVGGSSKFASTADNTTAATTTQGQSGATKTVTATDVQFKAAPPTTTTTSAGGAPAAAGGGGGGRGGGGQQPTTTSAAGGGEKGAAETGTNAFDSVAESGQAFVTSAIQQVSVLSSALSSVALQFIASLIGVFQIMHVWTTSIELPEFYTRYFQNLFAFVSIDFSLSFDTLIGSALVTPVIQLVLALVLVCLVVFFMLEDNKRFELTLSQYVWKRDAIEGNHDYSNLRSSGGGGATTSSYALLAKLPPALTRLILPSLSSTKTPHHDQSSPSQQKNTHDEIDKYEEDGRRENKEDKNEEGPPTREAFSIAECRRIDAFLGKSESEKQFANAHKARRRALLERRRGVASAAAVRHTVSELNAGHARVNDAEEEHAVGERGENHNGGGTTNANKPSSLTKSDLDDLDVAAVNYSALTEIIVKTIHGDTLMVQKGKGNHNHDDGDGEEDGEEEEDADETAVPIENEKNRNDDADDGLPYAYCLPAADASQQSPATAMSVNKRKSSKSSPAVIGNPLAALSMSGKCHVGATIVSEANDAAVDPIIAYPTKPSSAIITASTPTTEKATQRSAAATRSALKKSKLKMINAAGVFCAAHPHRRLTPQVQTDIWPFSIADVPSCCLIVNGALCGERCGTIFSCGQRYWAPRNVSRRRGGGDGDDAEEEGNADDEEEDGEWRVCNYALCEKHCRMDVVSNLMASLFGTIRRLRNNGLAWLFCVVIVMLANVAYTPFMKTALMILGCHPFYQCEFEHCWGDMDQKFALAVFCCLAVVVLFGLGFPGFMFFILWRRKHSMDATFLHDDYQGRYCAGNTNNNTLTQSNLDQNVCQHHNQQDGHRQNEERRMSNHQRGGESQAGTVVAEHTTTKKSAASAPRSSIDIEEGIRAAATITTSNYKGKSIAEPEWIRFTSTDATALAQQYQPVFSKWMYYPAVAIVFKVLQLLPAIFIEPRTLEQRIGCAVVQLCITLFVFVTSTHLSPVVLLTLRAAEIHNLAILGLQNIALVLLNDPTNPIDISPALLIVTAIYIVFTILALVALILLPIFQKLARKRRLTNFLHGYGYAFSEPTSLYVNPFHEEH